MIYLRPGGEPKLANDGRARSPHGNLLCPALYWGGPGSAGDRCRLARGCAGGSPRAGRDRSVSLRWGPRRRAPVTRGRNMDGAITGAVSGVPYPGWSMALLVASATTITSLGSEQSAVSPTLGDVWLLRSGPHHTPPPLQRHRRGGTVSGEAEPPGRANGPGGSGLVSAESSSPPQFSSSSVQFSSLTSSARCSWSLQSSAGSSRGLLPEERRGTASRLGS